MPSVKRQNIPLNFLLDKIPRRKNQEVKLAPGQCDMRDYIAIMETWNRDPRHRMLLSQVPQEG